MRLESWIKDRRVIVLIDNGFTHNFVNQTVARKLGLKSTPVEPFQVRIANGEKLTCDKLYKSVPIRMQGAIVTADLFALPLGGLDAVLGVQWLEKLGRVTTDYLAGTMEFQWGDGMITLKANIEEPIREVGLKTIERIVRQRGQCYLIKESSNSQVLEPLTGNPQYEIQQILKDYSTVLQEPQGLPPNRPFDHQIPLKNESQSVNVHPYRYAQFQKAEIERQVKDMLANGLIRPSSSPFS